MDFVAIDVETANANMASICQVGIAGFSNGKIVDHWKSYVDPQDHFDGLNVSIHGIDETTISGAPVFSAIAEDIEKWLNKRIVVTHTAFDRVALAKASSKYSSLPINCTWLDSACVARRTWNQFSRSGYGLHSICDSIGYKFQHHDALEDAKAAGEVLLAAMQFTGMDLGSWLVRVRHPIDLAAQEPIVRHGNPDGELFGEVLVFTGALAMIRREAADLAAQAGCEVDASVTKRTTILVVGDQDIQKLAGHEKSRKHEKAEELIRKGQPIRIICESDFCSLVNISG